MTKQLPSQAQVVIIGGGIHGCSVAYHLARCGWTDVVLLERKQLTSGTTWHAAGLVGQLQGSHATTAFASYGVELLRAIEAETGQDPGFRQSGSISIALNGERMAELKRKADFASLFGIEARFMEVAEIAERWPLMNPEGVLGGIYMPSDGSANPIDLTNALAKGARMHGATLHEGVRVEEVLTDGGRVTGVRTGQGEIAADFVVNCAGMWARELVCPHRSNRVRPSKQDGRALRRYRRRWIIERTISWLQDFRRLVTRYEFYSFLFHSFAKIASLMILLRRF